ncbi:MAG TPA: hypothetical protein VE421_04870, partial [Burkholderiaceae bacterium]|nr:hypothetical protein [Burkholderiaceae bacterium]
MDRLSSYPSNRCTVLQPTVCDEPQVAKVTVTSELFKLSLELGRTTWFGNLAFGLLVVLILWR